jgi:hypothetical protein
LLGFPCEGEIGQIITSNIYRPNFREGKHLMT